MKEFPKLGAKVRVTGISSIVESESFLDAVSDTMAHVEQTGTSGAMILCHSKVLHKYFVVSKDDIEPYYPLGKIYIAGAISGLPLHKALESFQYAEESLKVMGYEAINPMTISHHEAKELESIFESTKELMNVKEIVKFQQDIHKAYMKGCISAVLDCDQIAALDGWERSKGACIELFTANEYGYKIYKFPEMEIINIM